MFNCFTNCPLVKGIAIGVGASALGFCLYKANEEKVDAFLRRHGINVKTPSAGFDTMSVEDLMRAKENIEDLIAEKEFRRCCMPPVSWLNQRGETPRCAYFQTL